jgi:hypothetical protein
MDSALAQRCLWIEDSEGTAIAGALALGPCENAIVFRPELAWDSERYVLRVDPVLEDVAGNSALRPFDRDVSDESGAPRPSSLRFACAFSPKS